MLPSCSWRLRSGVGRGGRKTPAWADAGLSVVWRPGSAWTLCWLTSFPGPEATEQKGSVRNTRVDGWPVLVLQRLNKSAGSEASASPAEKWAHFLPQGINLGASGRQALCHRISAGFGPRNSPVFSTHQQMGRFIPGTLLAEFRARCYNLKFFLKKHQNCSYRPPTSLCHIIRPLPNSG